MIDDSTIGEVIEFVAQRGIDATSLGELRGRLDGVHLTHCMDDDVGGVVAPVGTTAEFNIYLVDGRDLCLKFTGDMGAATGLAIAEVDPDG